MTAKLEINKAERGKEFYDQAYKNGGYNKMYAKHYKQSPYINVWKKAIDIISEVDHPKFIEIGCGVGQFANLLFDSGFDHYKGIDFSDEAIRMAKITNSNNSEKFSIDNAYSSAIYNEEYNVVIIFEVLEHLKEDKEVLRKIKKGAHVLFSVPNFNSASHVRYFENENDVFYRYNQILNIVDLYSIKVSTKNIIYLGHGIKK